MELRKDPITQSWVIQENGDGSWPVSAECPLCPGQEHLCAKPVYEHPFGFPDWEVRVIPHLRPLYHIEGDAQRRGEGIYDKMRTLGAHEIVVEHRDHKLTLSRQDDEHFAQVLRAYVTRVTELKGDRRFRYVTVFRNQGFRAGQELDHPHSQITAMPFIPRRLVYELRSCERHFELKERCLLCDILRQELKQQVRTVDWNDWYVAFCPFASRVPYETWVLPIKHHCSFERDLASWDQQLGLARFLKSLLQRLESVAPDYQLILHTSPNTTAKFERGGYWQTLAEDFHWHFEIVPMVRSRPRTRSIREVYYNALAPEIAAEELRRVGVETRVMG